MIGLRKLTATAIAAVAVSVFLQTPAHADVLEPPTDITLSWQGDKLHLTWKDKGEANSIYVDYAGQGEYYDSVHADDANDVLLPANLRQEDRVRLALYTNDASGRSSQPAYTAWFDTRAPLPPVIEDAGLLPDSSVQLRWTQDTYTDVTPNDPLDRPEKLWARVDGPAIGSTREVQFPVGSTRGTIKTPARPAAIYMVAGSDWGDTLGHGDSKTVLLAKSGAGISVPAQQVYSQRLGIKSTLSLALYDHGVQRITGIPVELQARATSTAPWKTYGRYAGNTTTAFDTGIAALGNRQYRLWVPARKKVTADEITLIPTASTSAKSSITLAKFTTAGFTPSTAQVGATVKLSVKIQPASTVQGILQRWDGKKWINGSKVQLKNGTALVPIKASVRGTSRYRVALGPIVFNGLHLNATQSPTFTLTAR